MTVLGARPQFVKAAVVSREFARRPGVEEVIVHTGQHFDDSMSDVFFREMEIPKPGHYLGIGGGSHGEMTGRQLEAVEKVLVREAPDAVLVYGDTNSTLAGALAAAKLNIPVAHVEAGLRSFNRRMPEEINRVLTDHLSDRLFVPAENARLNLAREGIVGGKVMVVGDVMYDAALHYRARARKPDFFDGESVGEGGYVLCTVHRAESTDSAVVLKGILDGLGACGHPVLMPIHPRTAKRLSDYGLEIPSNVRLFDPVGYLEMIWLQAHCRLIATDSGGVQKEAYFHRRPCVTLRAETEWVELVEAGCNVLAGTEAESIASAIRRAEWPSQEPRADLFGDGAAAVRIVDALLESAVNE